MPDLSDQVALVTGCAGGIGTAVCHALIEAGALVYGGDISSPKAADLSDLKAPENFTYVPLDVTSERDWEAVTQTISGRHGKLDALVQNAGVVTPKPVTDMTRADFQRMYAVNVEGLFIGTKMTLGLLREAGRARPHGSSLITLSSVAAKMAAPLHVGYCTTKGAALMFAKSCAVEFAAYEYNIRSNAILPGGVDTPMMDYIFSRYTSYGLAHSTEQSRAVTVAAHPLGRMATAQDIARAVRYLASDEASFMTGSELVVDGGFTSV